MVGLVLLGLMCLGGLPASGDELTKLFPINTSLGNTTISGSSPGGVTFSQPPHTPPQKINFWQWLVAHWFTFRF
jgi:hypothetical protein